MRAGDLIAQTPTVGIVACGEGCEDWDLVDGQGEVYAFKLPGDDFDADPDLLFDQRRPGGTRLGMSLGDVARNVFQVPGNAHPA